MRRSAPGRYGVRDNGRTLQDALRLRLRTLRSPYIRSSLVRCIVVATVVCTMIRVQACVRVVIGVLSGSSQQGPCIRKVVIGQDITYLRHTRGMRLTDDGHGGQRTKREQRRNSRWTNSSLLMYVGLGYKDCSCGTGSWLGINSRYAHKVALPAGDAGSA